MNDENKITQPVILIGLTILILIAISFIKIEEEINVFGITIQEVDILSDLKEAPVYDDYYDDDYYDDEYNDEEEDEVRLKRNLIVEQNFSKASFGVIDNINDAAVSFIYSEIEKFNNSASIEDIIEKRKIEGKTDQLKYFFEAIKKANTKKIRIAHYGDSQIEGDLVTGAIRDRLQKKFGGEGAGYLALTSQDRMFRITTDHKYPDDTWETGSIFVSNRNKWPLGIGGEVFVPTKSTWVSYETRGYFSTVRKFKIARLFYSDAKILSINYSFDGGVSNPAELSTGSNVKELILEAKKKVTSLKLEFTASEQAYFYGVSLESGSGIYVDNLPLRGNTGDGLQKIPMDKLQDFNKLLDYKLIILQFGKNAMGANYIRYEREMAQAIEHLKKAFPQCSFLMISVQDSGFKTGSRTTGLLSSQIRIAKKTGIAFWNLFEAMGGRNSMSKWVKSSPPMASADHTHFNHEGSKKVGEMIVEALLDAYDDYK
ncbi:hypothetical protein ACFLR4_03300 [Bacteroidota bacterium]